MMNNPGFILLAIIALCVPLFGSIIYYGLKSRKANMDQWIKETNARLVESQFALNNISVSSLLYGNFYDSSPTKVCLLVKDRNDKEVGKVNYEIGTISIEAGGENFRIFNEMKSHFHITVRPIKGKSTLEPQIAECVSKGIFTKSYIYDFPNFGKIEFKLTQFGRRATIIKEGIILGEWFRLGPYELSGKALVLSANIPLIFQLILLGGPFMTRRSVPY
jgi:hypothetical protein